MGKPIDCQLNSITLFYRTVAADVAADAAAARTVVSTPLINTCCGYQGDGGEMEKKKAVASQHYRGDAKNGSPLKL